MGSLRLTLCTGLLAACALTPPVYAADGGEAGISVTPSSAAPGADVALRVTGCSAATATAASMAFVADANLAGADGTLAGSTRVRASVGPGSYDVKITCAGLVINGSITVVSRTEQSEQSVQSEEADQPEEAEQADQPSQSERQQLRSPSEAQAQTNPQSDPQPQPDPSASHTAAALAATLASPAAPAHASGGGTAHSTPAGAHAAVPGIGHAITGLLLAGVAVAAAAVLRASRSRRTG